MGLKDFFNRWNPFKSTNVVMALDEEKILTNETIKGQQRKIASHEGTIGQLLGEKRLQKAKEKTKDKEKEIIAKVKEQEN